MYDIHHYIVIVLLLFALDNTSFSMGSIGEASTEFGVDVFKELKVQHVNENILVSPLTIISALSMVYIGSRENTRAQIDKVRLLLRISILLLLNRTIPLSYTVISLV